MSSYSKSCFCKPSDILQSINLGQNSVSELYPNSVTKHKQKKKQQPCSRTTCASLFLDSSESEDRSPRKQTGGKIIESVKNGSKKTDSNQLSDSDPDSPLFQTPNPIRRFKPGFSGNSGQKDKKSSIEIPVAKPKSVTSFNDYISLSDDDGSSVDDDSLSSRLASDKENTAYNQTPQKPKSVCDSDVFSKIPTPMSKFKTPSRVDMVSGKGVYSYSFLKSLSATTEDHRRHLDSVR